MEYRGKYRGVPKSDTAIVHIHIDEISMLPSDLFNRINANLVNALNHIQEKTPLHPCLEYLDSAKPFINLNIGADVTDFSTIC